MQHLSLFFWQFWYVPGIYSQLYLGWKDQNPFEVCCPGEYFFHQFLILFLNRFSFFPLFSIYYCSFCTHEAPCNAKLEDHIRSKHTKEGVKCPECPKILTNRAGMLRHYNSQHKNKMESQPSVAPAPQSEMTSIETQTNTSICHDATADTLLCFNCGTSYPANRNFSFYNHTLKCKRQ